MQVVIEISEEAYNLLKGGDVDWLGSTYILGCVAEGKVLPKGHGRLIDADAIVYEKECVYLSDGSCTTESTPNISATPTIIEADKEGE